MQRRTPGDGRQEALWYGPEALIWVARDGNCSSAFHAAARVAQLRKRYRSLTRMALTLEDFWIIARRRFAPDPLPASGERESGAGEAGPGSKGSSGLQSRRTVKDYLFNLKPIGVGYGIVHPAKASAGGYGTFLR